MKKTIDELVCSKCKESKKPEEMGKDNRRLLGFGSRCRSCLAKYLKGWYQKNRNKHNNKNNRHYKENKKQILSRQSLQRKTPNGIKAQQEYAKKRAKIYPERVKSRALATLACLRGDLVRGICAGCGGDKVQMHHEDYSKPYEVIWVCSEHHGEICRRVR